MRRKLAILTAVVMLFTTIPTGGLSIASRTDVTSAPEVTMTGPPTAEPTPVLTSAPTEAPTEALTEISTEIPTAEPTAVPTELPTEIVTEIPTTEPTEIPDEVLVAETTEMPVPTPAEVWTEVPAEKPAESITPDMTEAPTEIPEFEIVDDVLVRYHGDSRKVVIPRHVKEIGDSAFMANETIEKVVLGENVEIIRTRAFAECIRLETVVINEKLNEIEARAFENCEKLDVTFARDVEKVASSAFKGCVIPTAEPTAEPTEEPTAELTVEPTEEPTAEPTAEPTEEPTAEPTVEPTEEPTAAPTAEPTEEPTAEPTVEPTEEPTAEPTAEPTEEPTAEPTVEPTEEPTAEPTVEPTEEPTTAPTAEPTEEPTAEPTTEPTPTVTPAVSTETDLATPEIEPTAVPTPKSELISATDTDLPEQETPATSTDLATDTDLPEQETPATSTDLATDTDLPEQETPATSTDPATDTDLPEQETPATSTDLATDTDLPEQETPATSTDLATDTDLPEQETPATSTDPATDTDLPEQETPATSTDLATDTDLATATDLVISLTADAEVAYAGEEPVFLRTTVEGGSAPYLLCITSEVPPTDASADMAASSETITEETLLVPGEYVYAYAPMIAGAHVITATVTAADGETAQAVLTLITENRTYANLLAEVEAWELLRSERTLTTDEFAAAEELYVRITETYEQALLTEDEYSELLSRLGYVLYRDVAEHADGTNWQRLVASGYFTAYSAYANPADTPEPAADEPALMLMNAATYAEPTATPPSDVQVDERGGEESDEHVKISKTIAGTELENVFDITLTVETQEEIHRFYEEPDMAVVIVMDISNTMTDNFSGITRYEAAMRAAETFLDKFAAENQGASRVGFVAFNTDAHEIFGLSSCQTEAEVKNLKNTMRSKTGKIINASGYKDSHTRFTNVESGLNMGYDMLKEATNKNKYIIFLSDGFPTTYAHPTNANLGWDPYCDEGTEGEDGTFYDSVLDVFCLYGTSYSDKAAIKAREKAESIKKNGVKIFSIGVDVGGQTIQEYIESSEESDGFSVVDRTGTTYEIGDPSSTESYKTWLKYSIGSGNGCYFDSTNLAGLNAAYDEIFATILKEIEESTKAEWVAEDPLPELTSADKSITTVDFIGMYDRNGKLQQSLEATESNADENTASYVTSEARIRWDLKASRCDEYKENGKTVYRYKLTYRVRLQNEEEAFVENQVYDTNGTTTLSYRYTKWNNDKIDKTELRSLDFPIPAVHGYLGELEFTKVDQEGIPLPDVEFTLSHDTGQCSICHGDGKPTELPEKTAISDENGKVSFTRIPSGHIYKLTETSPPDGLAKDPQEYTVTVAYDKVTVDPAIVDGKVVNTLTKLTVSKLLLQAPESENQFDFHFTIAVTGADGKPVSGDFPMKTVQPTLETANGTLSLTNGTGEFTLRNGQSVSIYKLPAGAKAVITETDGNGYKVETTVTQHGGSETKTAGTVTPAVTIDAGTTVKFTNTAMYELPNTGGPGRDMYTWVGMALCALSCLLYSQKKRRRGGESRS